MQKNSEGFRTSENDQHTMIFALVPFSDIGEKESDPGSLQKKCKNHYEPSEKRMLPQYSLVQCRNNIHQANDYTALHFVGIQAKVTKSKTIFLRYSQPTHN
ncbi:hypothetical protein AVEN_53503-1 [Araneus ventricosus]|uniref:Uncharacterized protein n=1 Tax=Araneus ventricosus TaxID=182803 RepID=A0A4Y2JAL6_ARAVE|nr:hypothetical protein AVEN_53503-1 [Araneus ventricosus]